MLIRFVCWNTQRKPLLEEVARLASEKSADFVIVIENTATPGLMNDALSRATGMHFVHAPNTLGTFEQGQLYYKTNLCAVRNLTEHSRYSIRSIATRGGEFLLAIVHLPSRQYWGDPSNYGSLCRDLMNDIRYFEAEAGHRRTIVIGDFNMNPFEPAMVESGGMHAMMSRDIATNGSRVVLGKEHHFFYNPMWAFLGSGGRGEVSGTHYYNTGAPLNYYWNMFDQVLIRPDLLGGFDENSLEIVTGIGGSPLTKLIRNETRVNTDVSDHLPITFAIDV